MRSEQWQSGESPLKRETCAHNPTRSHRSGVAWWLIASVVVLSWGCAQDQPGPNPQAPGEQGGPSAETLGETADNHRPTQTTSAIEAMQSQAMLPAVRAQLEAGLPAELERLLQERSLASTVSQSFGDEALGLTAERAALLSALYAETSSELVFVGEDGRLNERAQEVLTELRAAYQHALDPTHFHLEQLAALEAALQTPTTADTTPWLTPESLELLAETASHIVLTDGESLLPRMAVLAAGLEGESPTPDIAERFADLVDSRHQAFQSAAQMEVLLADALLQYAFEMHVFNVTDLTEEDLEAQGGAEAVQTERLRTFFRGAREASGANLVALLEGLVPHLPQYAALMESLARYRSIVESGGWAEVEPRSLRPGSNNPRVAELKQRLAIEGYYEGPIDEEFDDALEQAVMSYQEAHQMEATGHSDEDFWRSLNTTAEQRLAQIELTLQRWRESRIGDDPYYVYVNVPDFHAEVWRDGERISRFRVVVGNTVRECDSETRTMTYVNATPLLSATIQYMVVNPYWNVPARIRREELELEIMEDPTWLQEHGFEVVVGPEGPRMRQLPGPGNALGQVKFIFPNPFNFYMHDTPLRRYFEYDVRAFSHGCVRVHNPLEFAELLLTVDGQWNERTFERLLDSRVETTIHLTTDVPIHVEYYVVRVDDEGRTNFLSDIYRYDRARLEGTQPERCRPEPEVASQIVWNPDGTVLTPDGTIINPDGTVLVSATQPLPDGTLPLQDGQMLEGTNPEVTPEGTTPVNTNQTNTDGIMPLIDDPSSPPQRILRRQGSGDNGP